MTLYDALWALVVSTVVAAMAVRLVLGLRAMLTHPNRRFLTALFLTHLGVIVVALLLRS